MHDPQTLVFTIPFPWFTWTRLKTFSYRCWHPFISVWHVDPEKDHTDDSCGWFIRARHCNKVVLEKIVTRLSDDWDRVWKSDCGTVYDRGYFHPSGDPRMSVHGIILNFVFLTALEVFKSNNKKARHYCQKRLFEILLFAENPTDSLFDNIKSTFADSDEAQTPYRRTERIREMAELLYPWVLRDLRPWWKHPRFHFWHWQIQVHPWQKLRRWLFDRCSVCRGRFDWKESPITDWHHTKVWHQHCDDSAKSIP